ncbi:zinc finger protein 217-like [Petromyzon marinus]|uniref:zinc finger protein 217-like n=1 Tax=Petromyzon marinus TaxID=7757 RepID=UPI003F6FD3B3
MCESNSAVSHGGAGRIAFTIDGTSSAPVSTPPQSGRVTRPKKLISCDVCGKKFQLAWCLEAHVTTHKETHDQWCRICGQRFEQLGKFKRHVKTHEKDYVIKGAPGLVNNGSFANAVLNPPSPYEMCSVCGVLCPIEILKTHESLHAQFLYRPKPEHDYASTKDSGVKINDMKSNFPECFGLVPHQQTASPVSENKPYAALDPITSMKVLMALQQKKKEKRRRPKSIKRKKTTTSVTNCSSSNSQNSDIKRMDCTEAGGCVERNIPKVDEPNLAPFEEKPFPYSDCSYGAMQKSKLKRHVLSVHHVPFDSALDSDCPKKRRRLAGCRDHGSTLDLERARCSRRTP